MTTFGYIGAYFAITVLVFSFAQTRFSWQTVKWMQRTLIYRAILVTVIFTNVIYLMETTKEGKLVSGYLGVDNWHLHFMLFSGLLIIISQFMYMSGCPRIIQTFEGFNEYLDYSMRNCDLNILQEENVRLNFQYRSVAKYDTETIHQLAKNKIDNSNNDRLEKYLFADLHYTALNESTNLLLLRLIGFNHIMAILLFFHPAITRITKLAWIAVFE
ncbi:MAG: hypothetical protein FJX62_15045 [Alphaproteobacteria bacterium]|nr:hypothetical protein [Alphaproteobacteria bacterium]